MIYERVSSIEVSRLTPEQMDAIRVALYQRELSLCDGALKTQRRPACIAADYPQ
jgi:hypothetical protein